MPPLTPAGIGYGAGTRVLKDRANVLTAVLGEPIGAVEGLTLLETTVDDVTGETLGHLLTEVIAAGAADAWLTPALMMKKNRPGHVIHVLTHPQQTAALERLVFAETGSLGLRRVPM